MRMSVHAVLPYHSPRVLPPPDKSRCEGYFTIINPHCAECERFERCRARSKVVQVNVEELKDRLQAWHWRSMRLDGLIARAPVMEGV